MLSISTGCSWVQITSLTSLSCVHISLSGISVLDLVDFATSVVCVPLQNKDGENMSSFREGNEAAEESTKKSL